MRTGTLYLIPVTLSGGQAELVLPRSTLERLFRLKSFVVEDAKSARAFLKAAGHPCRLRDMEIRTLNEHTPAAAVASLLDQLLGGTDCGLLSESGCPAIADPGAELVRRAHERRIRVVPLVGPSAVLLAMMASGMNGQRFVFHGYLPADRAGRAHKLLVLERNAWQEDRTQAFIEAPYRNQALLRGILETCRPDTLLCLATDLTLASESVSTRTVAAWTADPPDIDRRPTVFLIYRGLVPPTGVQKR